MVKALSDLPGAAAKGTPPRFGRAYWSRVGETFALTSGALFVAQLTNIQDALGGNDPAALKKAGLALMAGLGTGLAKSLWLAYRFRPKH